MGKSFDKKDIIRTADDLVEYGYFDRDENGLFYKAVEGKVMNYTEQQVLAIIIPHIMADLSISNRELEARTGINRRTIARYRMSQKFDDMYVDALAKLCNQRNALHMQAVMNIIDDPDTGKNIKLKAIQIFSQFSEEINKRNDERKSREPAKEVSLDDLLKELDGM